MFFGVVVEVYLSGQIIATSHDRFPPNGGLVREILLFQVGEILFHLARSLFGFGRGAKEFSIFSPQEWWFRQRSGTKWLAWRIF